LRGDIMKKTGLALALAAILSMTVLPVAPSFAATPAPKSAKMSIADHAARGEAVILSQAQLERLAPPNPTLPKKPAAPHAAGKVRKLSAAEKKMLRTMTAGNLDSFKAGVDPATVWIVVAIVAAVLVLFTPIFCPVPLFAWTPGCTRYAPVAPAVAVRG